MDVFTALDPEADYTMPQLQMIITGWVMSHLFNGKEAVSMDNGHVEEDDVRPHLAEHVAVVPAEPAGAAREHHHLPRHIEPSVHPL